MASISPPHSLPDVEVDNTSDDPTMRAPLVTGDNDFRTVTEKVVSLTQSPPQMWWWIAFVISASIMGLLLVTLGYLVTTGIGVWGNNQPVGWGFDIINFVFWIGIGHAGTLISAILFLFRQNWRTSINRFAEAMTIFAVMCAGLFPAIHVGRPWFAYWLFPIPSTLDMWPQFRSPLMWDVFAVSTYGTVSLLFWYVGMVPDLATLRDRVKNKFGQIAYGILALGWNGSARHWHRFEKAYLILAALATPLVLSVHSVVSFDFAVSQIPGWHTTIFPPFFVAGAIFGGFAMVITLALPARYLFGFKDLITKRHLENMAKIMLATGLIVVYGYVMELFVGWYSGHHYEQYMLVNRMLGPYWWTFWLMIFLNAVAPQILWFKWCRTNPWTLLFAAMCVNVGMWFERFVIVVTSLHRDFLPSSWGMFVPTWVDYGMLLGSFGLFFTFFLLFLKFLPTVAMAEVKTVMPQAHAHGGAHDQTSFDERRSDYWPDSSPDDREE